MRTGVRISILWFVLIVSNIYAAAGTQKPQKNLFHCPTNSEHIEPFSETAYETRAKEYAINNIVSETFSDNIEPIQAGFDIIDISSNITTNTIWTSNNIYHVLNPVDVNGAMLVIEPGTTVTFAGGGSLAGINVLNGGALIARGTPDEPILFTSDAPSPYYDDYYYAVRFEETASTASQIIYCIVEWAYSGIALFNIDLDTNIENNYLMACVFGIVEYGPKHTDIINNLCFGSEYYGIYVNMASFSGIADANSYILIQNNTCDYYQDRGITVYGVDDCDYAGLVELKNNIVSGSYEYGISLWDCLYATVANTGFYNNAANKNWAFDDYNSVEAVSNPYIEGPGSLEVCYLDQSCAFIDAGLQYIEETSLIGKTTDIYGTPDSNKIDIGFHYPNWNYSNAGSTTLQADFDNSLTVDFNDLAFFTDYWLFDYDDAYEVWWWDWDGSGMVDIGDLAVVAEYWLSPFDFVDFADFARQWQREVDYRLFDTRPDFNKDNIVNFKDFAVLANEWGMTGDAEPNIIPIISGDPNNGYIGISVSEFPSTIKQVFVFDSGKYINTLYGFEGAETLAVDISESGVQDHHFKITSISKTGQITCSNITDIAFSCPLRYCFLPRDYEPNKPLHFAAYNSGSEDVSVNVYADGGNLVWFQTCSGNNVFGSVPTEITSQHYIDYVTLSSTSRGVRPIIKPITPRIREREIDPATQALIIQPDLLLDLLGCDMLNQVERAFIQNGIKFQRLGWGYAASPLIAAYGWTCPIKYIYVLGHGGYQYDKKGGVLRTRVRLIDGVAVSVKRSDFPLYQWPSWCEELEPELEYSSVFSWAGMGFHSLEFAYFNCCYSGHLKINANNELVEGQRGHIGGFDGPHSDMSYALGMASTSRDCAFQGWYDEAWFALNEASPFSKWTLDEWSKLSLGVVGGDLYTAIQYAISKQTSFMDPNVPVNTYRIKGHGSINEIGLHN